MQKYRRVAMICWVHDTAAELRPILDLRWISPIHVKSIANGKKFTAVKYGSGLSGLGALVCDYLYVEYGVDGFECCSLV